MSDWVGIFITLISLFFGGFVLGVKWGEGKPLLDIKEYLKQTKTVLVTQDAFDELVKKASAQPECKTGRWIPCSERLPFAEYGESDTVLTTCGYKDVEDTSVRWIRELYFNGGNWCYPTGETYEQKVYAWMPLPEPYKEGEG